MFLIPGMTRSLLVMVIAFLLHIRVRDLITGAPLLHGPVKDGLYEWPTSPKQPVLAFSGVKVTPHQWHSRLGHPSSKILRHIFSTSQLQINDVSSLAFNC
ncbi:unnamed protein product, partial [Cuscuta epithymum]